jgi:hypothetical protein
MLLSKLFIGHTIRPTPKEGARETTWNFHATGTL